MSSNSQPEVIYMVTLVTTDSNSVERDVAVAFKNKDDALKSAMQGEFTLNCEYFTEKGKDLFSSYILLFHAMKNLETVDLKFENKWIKHREACLNGAEVKVRYEIQVILLFSSPMPNDERDEETNKCSLRMLHQRKRAREIVEE
jgi:hypothetical protein